MDRTYTGSYGRLKVSFSDFLSNQFITGLISRDLEGIEAALRETSYRDDIEQLASLYKLPELLDFAVNRHLIKKTGWHSFLHRQMPGLS
ncbi:V-type ATP synthase subunit C [mine drainage metagenome]|uniref:V-type ATP synthase subunit C n=1 Tax=mine drainage metagenome TaxID=410659 RepID=T0ZX69_9ZZZZ